VVSATPSEGFLVIFLLSYFTGNTDLLELVVTHQCLCLWS